MTARRADSNTKFASPARFNVPPPDFSTQSRCVGGTLFDNAYSRPILNLRSMLAEFIFKRIGPSAMRRGIHFFDRNAANNAVAVNDGRKFDRIAVKIQFVLVRKFDRRGQKMDWSSI